MTSQLPARELLRQLCGIALRPYRSAVQHVHVRIPLQEPERSWVAHYVFWTAAAGAGFGCAIGLNERIEDKSCATFAIRRFNAVVTNTFSGAVAGPFLPPLLPFAHAHNEKRNRSSTPDIIY